MKIPEYYKINLNLSLCANQVAKPEQKKSIKSKHFKQLKLEYIKNEKTLIKNYIRYNNSSLDKFQVSDGEAHCSC